MRSTDYKDPQKIAICVDDFCENQQELNACNAEGNNDHPMTCIELPDGNKAFAVWYEKYGCYITIRKLTPKECFRLQGWTDDYIDKAQFVNSDSQLYKQAGNGVTVPVIYEIAKRFSAEEDNDAIQEEQEAI